MSYANIMTERASSMLQWEESVYFDGVGFVLIESIIFLIFGLYTLILGFCILLMPSTRLFTICV